ncbi:MAG: hypothetical protein ACXVLO_06790 [Acidimicrobiia bacterium]
MHLDPKTWWYVTRASGFVAWTLLAVSILWGLFITNKTLARSTAPAWVLDLHRHLGGLAVAFVAVHVGALPLDGYTHWGVSDLFVPMATTWHPVAIAIGIVAMYLLLAVEITSLMGRRFPRVWWRRIHMLSFPLYVLASVHLFAAGTDAGNVISRWMVVTVSTLVAFLAGTRLLAVAKPRETPSRVPAAARAARDGASGTAPSHSDAGSDAPATATTVAGDLLPAREIVPAAHPDGAGASARTRSGPRSVEERAELIRARAQRAAARQATAPDSRSAATSASANPQSESTSSVC